MANDKRLPFAASDASPTTDTKPLPHATGCQIYLPQVGGEIEWRHQWLPLVATGSQDAANGNRAVHQMRIRSTDFMKAFMGIIGWAEIGGGDAGTSLKRRLPILDPDGLGMIAVRIVNWRFHGASELKPGADILYDGPGDTNPSDNQTPRQPTTPTGQADLFKDDCYTSPNKFNFDPLEGGGLQASIRQTRYCVFTIEFAHVMYPVATDETRNSVGNVFGQDDERCRFMYSTVQPGIETVTSKAMTIRFGAGAVDHNGVNIAGRNVGAEAVFMRPAGDVVLHWFSVPVEAMDVLFERFENYYGSVNQAAFKIPQFGASSSSSVKSYDAGELMFLAPRIEERTYPTGYACYDIHLNFAYRAYGWNKFLTGLNATPQPVERQDGSKLYTEKDFGALFQV